MSFGAGYNWNSSGDNAGASFLARLLARKPAEDQDAEAHVRWGKASSFVVKMRGEQYLPSVNIINWPGFPKNEDDEKEQPVKDWFEVNRTTSDVRVENPDDSDQYVIVQRCETVVFRTPEGELIRLNFQNGEGN